jgi:beta-lactam-binding protein with PASTA domain
VAEDEAGAAVETWAGEVALETPAAGRSKAGLLVALGLAVAALVAFVVVPAFRADREPREPGVPAVVGKTQDEAEKAVVAAGFARVVTTLDVEDASKDGVVLEQVPAGGAALEKGSAVKVVVGRGPRPVPDVVGRTAVEAGATLSGRGLLVVSSPRDAADAEDGRVLEQKPAAGASLRPGATVELVVGRKRAAPAAPPSAPPAPPATPPAPPAEAGTAPSASPAETTRVPDVILDRREVAERKLTAAGLVPVVTFGVGASGTVGHVIGQKPAGGTVPRGTKVEIQVGQAAGVETPAPASPPPGPPSEPPPAAATPPAKPPEEPPPAASRPQAVEVPDVLGVERAKAESDVRAAGLEPTVLYEEVGPGTAEGIVLRQTPSAGELVATGSGVEVLISRATAEAPSSAPASTAAPSAPPAPRAEAGPGRPLPGLPRGAAAPVPDVRGKDGVAAVQAMFDAGFLPVVRAEPDAVAKAGSVRAQWPAGGASLARGDVATLWVSSGWTARMTDVPDVVGLSLDAAKSALSAGGQGVDVRKVGRASGAGADVVAAQVPAGRWSAEEAHVVTVWVVAP